MRRPSWLQLIRIAAASAIFSVHAAGPRFDIASYAVSGNTLLPAAELDAILAPYAGGNRDFDSVQHAVAALQKAYAQRGYNLVRVVLPEQELNHGVVRIEVVETRIGRVIVEGNRFFDSANIRRSVPGLIENEKPNIGRISASLAQANENPAKKTTLNLQGGAGDSVDARLSVIDEKPWRVTFTADNTGNPETGRTYLGLVYQNSNVANRDNVVSLQYTTTAEEPSRVHVYGIGYHVPLYALGDSIDLYANYSDVDSGTVLAGIFNLQLSGRGTIAGARYNHAFARTGDFQSSVSLGVDHKAYENAALLFDFDLGSDITVHPVSLAWWGTWKSDAWDAAFTLTGVHNIPGGKHASDADFAAARAGAEPAYNLARYGFTYSRVLPAQWQARIGIQGQYTRDKLVPGEQFGAGGVSSVRGFSNRDVTGDRGYSGTAEIYTPDLCGRWAGAYCRALAFYDAARVVRNDALPGEPAKASIASAGVGLRAALGRHAGLQLDYGHVLDGGFLDRRGDNKLNFRLALTY